MHLRSARVAAIDSVAAPISDNAETAEELPTEFVIYITTARKSGTNGAVAIAFIGHPAHD